MGNVVIDGIDFGPVVERPRKACWAVFDKHGDIVATFPYNRRGYADAHLAYLMSGAHHQSDVWYVGMIKQEIKA